MKGIQILETVRGREYVFANFLRGGGVHSKEGRSFVGVSLFFGPFCLEMI